MALSRNVASTIISLLAMRSARSTKEPRKPQNCLNCGAEHYHNNCWCSVSCKLDWEDKKRMIAWSERLANNLNLE